LKDLDVALAEDSLAVRADRDILAGVVLFQRLSIFLVQPLVLPAARR